MLGQTGADVEPGSFRDPSGVVYERDGRLLRQINRSFGARWDELTSSRFLADLQERGLLVHHATADVGLALHSEIAHAVIEPARVDFISYPYEWSFGMLKDAALVTLRAQEIASSSGFTLRDASAYNVQFHAGRPILIDTLSFQRAVPNSPWPAYRQFCEHFLAPLALMAHRDVRCGLLLRSFLDGVPIDLAATLLPGRTKLNLGLASHVHAHAGAQRRAARSEPARIASGTDRRRTMSPIQQAALIDNLRRTVTALSWEPTTTAWAGYADSTSYSDEASQSKDALVRAFLGAARGRTAWDLGANTGRFSAIAASQGYRVVAWDTDPGATELHYRALTERGETGITPLLVDLANPSPALGWGHAERRSFADRANADVVLALALVHHLAVGRNVPMRMIVDLFASIAPQLILEFVPVEDPMVQQLLGTREDVFDYPTIQGFRAAFESRFEIVTDAEIAGSGRRLLHLARR